MKVCVYCGKHRITGFSVSHSHKATKRVFYANLQHKKIFYNGRYQKVWVCTNCLKSAKDLNSIKVKEDLIEL
ncbi:MAG: 50S ribosomal protein L28 [bacterium]|nr:50S ribosomal protein L28 [bacterium]